MITSRVCWLQGDLARICSWTPRSKGGGILVIDVSGPHLVGLWPSDDVGGWPMAHKARSCLDGHHRVLEVALAVDREMVPRRFTHGDQEETHPRADDP